MKVLSKDYLFILILIVGSLVSFSVAAYIFAFNYSSLTIFCVSSECFNGILEVFKFPLSIAVATLTLAGFRAVVFRSQQAAQQIQETIAQNAFKNFMDHKKDFFNLLDEIEKQYGIGFYLKHELYGLLFPRNSPASFIYVSLSANEIKTQVECWIEEYNNIIEILNTNRCFEIDGGHTDYERFVGWLVEFVVFLSAAKIFFPKGECSVSSTYNRRQSFGELEKLNKFPSDLYSAIADIENAWKILLQFCFPGMGNIMVVASLTVSRNRINESLETVCGDVMYR